MTLSAVFLNASQAARRLGISTKALRLYEQRGLVSPPRTVAGWRAYGPTEIDRASDVVSLRALGLSLAQIARVLDGDADGLEPALAAHQTALEERIRALGAAAGKVRDLRDGLARGRKPTLGDLAGLASRAGEVSIAFDLPWPWGGERFELREVRPLTYITGPLGSGKTRLAMRLAETLPDAAFLGLDRAAGSDVALRGALDPDPALERRIERTLAWLIEDGATASPALTVLLAALEAERPAVLVVDMIEQGLDGATQEALIARLRRRGAGARPLFCLTRSTSILDLDAVGPDEAIIYCPANHGPPLLVAPHVGAPGYEALASCLASPEVRARTEGVVAWRPGAA